MSSRNSGITLILLGAFLVTGCGAIEAACNGFEMGHITKLLANIKPVIDTVEKSHSHLDRHSEEFYREVSSHNVFHVVRELFSRSPILRDRVTSGELAIVGALYEIATGEVVFYEDAQAASLEAAAG